LHAFDKQTDRQILTARPCVSIRSRTIKMVNYTLTAVCPI